MQFNVVTQNGVPLGQVVQATFLDKLATDSAQGGGNQMLLDA